MSVSPPDYFLRFLAKLTSRSVLGDEERQAILSLPGRLVEVQCSRDLVPLGERVNYSCLVVDGLIGRFGQNSEGLRQITAVYIGGDMADLHSVVAPDAGSALQALTNSVVLRVPHSALRDVARRYPALAEAFWRECAVDASFLAEWVVNVGRRDARTRAAHLLCEMAYRYDARRDGASFSFNFPVTQAQLADILALTSVHVNRTLRELREEKLADFRHRNVRVLNWSRLLRAGEFDPSYLQIRMFENDNLIFQRAALAAE